MEKFDKQNLFLAGLTFLLLAIALFTNLGLSPLRLEEPRRALVALEMLLNDNLIVPTVRNEFYIENTEFLLIKLIGKGIPDSVNEV